jgi:hypothetical protein
MPGRQTYTRCVVELAAILVLSTVVPLLLLVVLGVLLARRLEPAQRARRQAIATLCSQHGYVPGIARPAPDLRGLINPYSSADGKVVVADALRSNGKDVEAFALLSSTIDGLNMPRMSVLRQGQRSLTVAWGPVLELESGDFDKRFAVIAKDRRSAVMLLDPGMIQWVLDCENVSLDMSGDRVLAFVDRAALPAHLPAEPVEYKLLFKFWDGFLPRVPELLRSEYSTAR